MKYNKSISYTKNGIQKEFQVIVDSNNQLEITGSDNGYFDRSVMFVALGKELCDIARNIEYKRKCPFRFTNVDRDTYIEFAERKMGTDIYVIKKTRIMMESVNGNVKVLDCFLFDFMDYLVQKGFLYSNYFGVIFNHERLNVQYTVGNIATIDDLKNLGFIIPK